MSQEIKRMSSIVFWIILSSLLFFVTIGVKAEDNLNIIPNKITILYNSPDYSFADIDLDHSKIESVENVSDTVDVITLKNKGDASEIIDALNASEAVLAADYDAEAKMVGIPNDPYYANSQSYLKKIGYENIRVGNNSVKVAALDTGLDPNHEDLVGRVELSGYNYVSGSTNISDTNGHGTNVAGILAARTNNSIGISGTANEADVKIVPYVVLDSRGRGSLSNIAAALQTVATRDDIKIVNLSLAFDSSNDVLESICQQLDSLGKIIVASSGNSNRSGVSYPSRYNSVISVGAANEKEQRCDSADWGTGRGSNYGDGLDVLAPGDSICTTQSGSINQTQKYTKCSGTSFSTSMVSAACAIAASFNPNITKNEVREALSATSSDLYSSGWDIYSGYGMLRIDRFVNKFASNQNSSPSVPTPSPNGSLSLDKNSITLLPGSSDFINAISTGNRAVIWTSSNPMVATVSGGRVSAVSPGSTVITARLDGTDIKQTCTVTVLEYLNYEAHVQNIGWMPGVSDGEIAGTTGRGLALEALRFTSMNSNLGIEGRAHVENIGWQNKRSAGEVIGTTGRGLQIEAIELNLTGPQANSYDIVYRAHVENFGWTSWAPNGNPVGTQGHGLQIEAVQVRILPKGSDLINYSGDVNWTFRN